MCSMKLQDKMKVTVHFRKSCIFVFQNFKYFEWTPCKWENIYEIEDSNRIDSLIGHIQSVSLNFRIWIFFL
jgi:hypothetical protein